MPWSLAIFLAMFMDFLKLGEAVREAYRYEIALRGSRISSSSLSKPSGTDTRTFFTDGTQSSPDIASSGPAGPGRRSLRRLPGAAAIRSCLVSPLRLSLPLGVLALQRRLRDLRLSPSTDFPYLSRDPSQRNPSTGPRPDLQPGVGVGSCYGPVHLR